MTAMRIEERRPARDEWGFGEGEEIAPGLTALRLLGGGWRYEAYLAFDERLQYPVVVKTLRPDQVEDEAAVRGLRREAEVLGALNHPVIARLIRAELRGELPHLVLEFVDGPRLSSLIRRFGPLELDQVGPLATELASALHYLHANDLVHLDVKSKNVIMGAPPRLIDLSVARSVHSAAALDHPIGTNAYMSPEQCVPERGVPMQPASDVWGLGATLYEAIAGRLPWDRGTDDDSAPSEARWPQLTGELRPLRAEVPEVLEETVAACLAWRPEDRPEAREVREALEPLLQRPRRLVLNQLRPR